MIVRVITQEPNVTKSIDVVNQLGVFAARRAIHTVMQESMVQVIFIQKALHGRCQPHKTLGRIFDAKKNAMSNTMAAKSLCDIV